MNKKTEGAILQRDGKTYAIMTNTPQGMVSPGDLELIAAVAKKYAVPVMKITSGQRIILAGIRPEDLPGVVDDLGALAKPESGPGIKFVQGCLGTEMCRWGARDSLGMATLIRSQIRDGVYPAKVKIGVSGCQRCCSESQIRDIGVVGTTRGWIVFFGGNGGTKPRCADPVAWGLSDQEAADLVCRLLDYYRAHGEPRERTARFMERIGMQTLRSGLLSTIPYIPLENGR